MLLIWKFKLAVITKLKSTEELEITVTNVLPHARECDGQIEAFHVPLEHRQIYQLFFDNMSLLLSSLMSLNVVTHLCKSACVMPDSPPYYKYDK